MLQAFLPPLREAFQCSIILILLLAYPGIRERSKVLLSAVLLAFLTGFFASYVPGFGDLLSSGGNWSFFRYVFELALFYFGIVVIAAKIEKAAEPVYKIGVFVLGFLIFFFEATSVGFLVHDVGLMHENVLEAMSLAFLGTAIGFVPVVFYRWILRKVPVERALLFPGLLILAGAFAITFGGVGEMDEGSVLITLQQGIQFFMETAVKHLQHLLLISDHPFIAVPFAGLADFLSGDRTAMTLLVIFIMVPPLYLLARLVSRPDPVVSDIELAAHRRLHVAFFRRELVFHAIPVLVSVLLILVSLHAVNVSLNPLSEPVPIPVRETDGEPDILRIPLSDRLGDFTDGKLRKYVYYYGSKQILFLAILKPDGTVGLALDECEICKPAEWNKAAQGYAQRGENLVCKYCMTPIPTSTVNKPGGCNPIPVAFRMEEGEIVVELADLIRVFKSAKELDKKGTHL